MQKFFVNSVQIHENRAKIMGEDVNHIKNVLRMKLEDEILLGNKNTGESFLGKIKQIQNNCVIVQILNSIKSSEPLTYIHVFQGLPKADKMEQIIQKGTEIGVSEFTPLQLERCILRLDKKDENKKIDRWQKIAEVAAKQCKRDKIPKINFVHNLKNIYEKIKEYDIVLVAYEDEKQHSLKGYLKKQQLKKIAIIIGPEGGISKNEVEELKEHGALTVTLGKQILRTETASIVMASNILYELED